MKKIRYQLPIAEEIVIHRFSLVKAAMNAPRICKLRNVVNKTPQFLLFSTAKGGTKTIAHLSIAEGSSFLSLGRRILRL
jgi:hypothetical protein